MILIEKPNKDAVCAVCSDIKEGPGVLIPIDGTEDGGNTQAIFVHTLCLDLRCKRVESSIMIYQIEQDRYDVLTNKE